MIPTTIHTKTQHLYSTARATASRGYCSPVRKLKSASLRNFLYATIRQTVHLPTNRKPQAERHEGVHSTPMRHSKRARSARDLPLSTLPLTRPEKAIEFLSLRALQTYLITRATIRSIKSWVAAVVLLVVELLSPESGGGVGAGGPLVSPAMTATHITQIKPKAFRCFNIGNLQSRLVKLLTPRPLGSLR